jgi:dUTP pyrophosphatase
LLIKCKLINENASLPEYKTKGASGFDISSCEDITIKPNKVQMVKSGLVFVIKDGYEVQIRSRSGLAFKGISVFNSPGTIDSDYRGEIGILLFNSTNKDFYVSKGDRVAQGILATSLQASFELVNEVCETDRGSGGFGSTGIK